MKLFIDPPSYVTLYPLSPANTAIGWQRQSTRAGWCEGKGHHPEEHDLAMPSCAATMMRIEPPMHRKGKANQQNAGEGARATLADLQHFP